VNEEQKIWNSLKSGEIHALKELYELHHQDIYDYGKKFTADEQLIEDAIQETFLSTWRYRNNATLPSSVKHYLLAVFRNELLKIIKERSRVVYTEESIEFAFEISFEHKLIAGEDAHALSKQLNQALGSLTNRQREIIYYRFYENLSFDEIAGIMNMQTRATYKLMARAFSVLKEVIHPCFLLLIAVLKLLSPAIQKPF
jgi:RNA polymerase sigma factor (sigma-70 family)